MSGLNCNANVTCEICWTHTTNSKMVPNKTGCSTGSLSCTNFSTNFGTEQHNRMGKNHSARNASFVHICQICDKGFHSLFSLRDCRRNFYGIQGGSRAQNDHVSQVRGYNDDRNLKKVYRSAMLFSVNSQLENDRNRALIFAIDTQDPHILWEEKLQTVFDSQYCANELNLAFLFAIENKKDVCCVYYYAHKNKVLLE